MIQHLSQLKEQAAENLSKKERVFNPCKEEFSLDILGFNITIPAREQIEMTHNQAMIVKKRLANQLAAEREIAYISPEIIEELMKEIEFKV